MNKLEITIENTAFLEIIQAYDDGARSHTK